ncbi:MAG TPA: TonB-dependent receptor [Hyphomonadaceae bacterium]|jgi:outer membrane receptor protein involved in Fe transport|nr:TonB-dependent receptor [Hyphomonadaceae bacterium]
MASRLNRIRIGSSLAALMAAVSAAALLAAPASAQQTNPDTGIQTIIVTANQREENLQNVPLSATSIPQDTLSTIFTGGEDVLALAARVPGVYAESSNGRVAPRFYIRGLGNTDFDLAASQPVSIIMDDVVMENVVLKSTPVFDLDRVEVYRGPQGTLFGRNTTAGIIRFTSKKPTDTFEANANMSYGTYNTFTLDGGAGGPIGDMASVRASILYQHRDDWVDNAFTPGDDDFGGYDDIAGRLQLRIKPSDDLDILVNVHGRDLDGTAALFRANVFGPGNNKLNGNYDRERVFYDGGGGNPQAYEEAGASVNVTWDVANLTFTSISSMETANGHSRGDIDGGACAPLASPVPPGLTSGATDCFFPFNGVNDAVTYPGFIPFASDTTDTLDDLEQYTQEFRLASDTSQALNWQVGAYIFQSGFEVNTVGPGFPPSTTVEHENNAWALFGQASYRLSDELSVTGGLRYTDDEKTLTVDANGALNREIEDDHISWDASAMYNFTDNISTYGRIAYGFRGPSIQGRDIAFGSPPSLAQSEKVLSYEVGLKSILSKVLRLNGAIFTYKVDDIQLTAVGGSGNTVQLLNADKGEAWGAEFDVEFAPLDNLVFTGGLSYVDTEINDPGLSVGICAQCTVTDPTVVIGGVTRALVDGNPFPNAPEITADITARYSMPFGNDGEIFGFADVAYQGDTNLFLYESQEFRSNDQFEAGLKLGYARTDGSWEVAIFARNISDEDNIKGAIDFNNNTAFVNDPRIVGISLKVSN